MRCPFCGAQDTRVIDSRLASDGAQVRRRRECVDCAERFTTYEGAELTLPRVVKRDGRRQPFSEEKLRQGMLHALEKCPVGTDDVEAAISRIKNGLAAAGDREVSAKKIGDWVMSELRGLDQVAYVRFASVYRSFEDLRAFREVIDGLENELTPEMLRNQLRLLKED